MIKWDKNAFNSKGVLQVRDEELEAFSIAQLKDYKKDYFKNIHPLDVDDFIENYLSIRIEYHRLSPNKSKFGTTAITDGFVPIVSEENKFEFRFFKAGTICIDTDACNENENLIRSTSLHEAAHSQFDLSINKDLIGGATYLSDSIIIDGRNVKRKTDKDWMEYHANKYMSYMLMPSVFVKKLYKIKHDEIIPGKRLSKKKRNITWKIIYEMANFLLVSPTAMAWRMLTLRILSEDIFKSLEIRE